MSPADIAEIIKKFQQFLSNWHTLYRDESKVPNDEMVDKSGVSDDETIEIPLLGIPLTRPDFRVLFSYFGDIYYDPATPSTPTILLDSDGKPVKGIILEWEDYTHFLSIKHIENIAEKFPNKNILSAVERDRDSLFTGIKSLMEREFNVNITNFRVFTPAFMEKLVYWDKVQKENVSRSIPQLLSGIGYIADEIIGAIQRNEFILYPIPSLVEFLMAIKKHNRNISFGSLMDLFSSQLPERELTITLYKDDWDITYYISLKDKNASVMLVEQNEDLRSMGDTQERHKKLALEMIKKLKTPHNFLIKLDSLRDMCREIVSSPIPFSYERIFFLLSRVLYFYKDLGFSWNHIPRPLLHNGIYRFFLYSMGYRYFTFKLSYWAIPELIRRFIKTELGGSERIGLIFILNDQIPIDSRIKFIKKPKRYYGIIAPPPDTGKNLGEDALVLDEEEFLEAQMKNVGYKGFLKGLDPDAVEDLRWMIGKKFGYISHLILVDLRIIKRLEELFIFRFHTAGRGLSTIAKILKTFFDPRYIYISPLPPIHKHLMTLKPKKLLKELGPIITDLQEF